MSIEDIRKRYESSSILEEDLTGAFDKVVGIINRQMVALQAEGISANGKDDYLEIVMESFNILSESDEGTMNDPEVRVFENLSDEDKWVILNEPQPPIA